METEKNWITVVKNPKKDETKLPSSSSSSSPPGLTGLKNLESLSRFESPINSQFLQEETDSSIFFKDKIKSPCWYYNTGGCKNKDGSNKKEEDCKYLHVYSPHTLQRPQHITQTKPCDKFNLEGHCKWGDYCKYLHKNLSQEEWDTFYPGIPYALKINNQKRQMLDIKIGELESKINILEYKLKSMDEYYEQSLKLLKNSIN